MALEYLRQFTWDSHQLAASICQSKANAINFDLSGCSRWWTFICVSVALRKRLKVLSKPGLLKVALPALLAVARSFHRPYSFLAHTVIYWCIDQLHMPISFWDPCSSTLRRLCLEFAIGPYPCSGGFTSRQLVRLAGAIVHHKSSIAMTSNGVPCSPSRISVGCTALRQPLSAPATATFRSLARLVGYHLLLDIPWGVKLYALMSWPYCLWRFILPADGKSDSYK